MYAAFNFIADRQEDFLQNNIMRYQKSGQNIVSQKTDKATDTLRQYLNNGIINGSKLSEDWFPSVNSDVFISYSHDDADIAMALTGYLEKTFGLKVFVDSIYWDSADGLLNEIDDRYCVNKNTSHGKYNYTKRNYSTSHVHAMLSTAILKTMDKSEAVFFINTDKSIIPEAKVSIEEAEKIEESEGSYTRSPWLFEEIMFASLIRKEHGKKFRTDAVFNESRRDLPFEAEYRVPLEDMTTLSVSDFSEWENAYRNNRINGLSNLRTAHPLLSLYDLKFQKKVQQGVRQPIW